GQRVHGETRITASRSPIRKLMLVPRNVRPLAEAVAAIRKADLIVIGPGSLYTSILPNLLIPDIARAIAQSSAPRVYIANLMTQPGETTNYSVAQHLRAIQSHVKPRIVDYVVANRQKVSPAVARRYRQQGASQVTMDAASLRKSGVQVLLRNLLEEHDKIRHDSVRLARLLLDAFLLRSARTYSSAFATNVFVDFCIGTNLSSCGRSVLFCNSYGEGKNYVHI